MRTFVIFALVLVFSVPTKAQRDKFPLNAKVVSSSVQTVPNTGGVVTTRTPPAVREQFPNAPASSTGRIEPESYIATTVEIGERLYVLRGGTLIDPGEYPASIDKRTVRLVLTDKDKNGNLKIAKFYVISVEAKK
jgi:hypothetical protein